jgi:hypothetical protein
MTMQNLINYLCSENADKHLTVTMLKGFRKIWKISTVEKKNQKIKKPRLW